MRIRHLEFDITPEWERLFDKMDLDPLQQSDGIYLGLSLDFDFLQQEEPELALDLLKFPGSALDQGEAVLTRRLMQFRGRGDPVFCFIRPFNMPDNVHRPISSISVPDVDRIVSFNALVNLRAKQKQRILISCDQCNSCGFQVFTPAIKGIIEGPFECSKDEGGCGKRVGSTKFIRVDHESTLIDTLKIELEDVQDHAFMGTPGKITSILEGDLVTNEKKRIEAGDRVKITGIYRLKPNKSRDGFREAEHDGYIDVLHVESDEKFTLDITSTDIESFHELKDQALLEIKNSLSPTIEGYDNIKLALTLSLFGGVSGYKVDGSYQRGEIHIIMVGDPSTAKSQLGDGTLRLAPRGYFASGKSTTGVGLIGAVVKDSFSNGEFVLHAGILNKADKGLCFIDELDKISPMDRDNLREAMEKGKVPINKGGISTELYARATIIAGANPIEETFQLETQYPLKNQNPLSDALRSRFDLSYYIYYEPDILRDRKVIEKMTLARMGDISLCMSWDKDFIRKYVHFARINFNPTWSTEVSERINKEAPNLLWQFKGNLYYRQIETLYRLSEASARSRLSNEVSNDDVSLAFSVLKNSLHVQENGQEASSNSVLEGKIECLPV